MLQSLTMLAGGGLLLYLGGEWLVSGAAGLARALGIAPLLVGLTVIAFGTSMPEVVVSVQAAHAGHGSIALGNVIGSNIANLGLILAITAIVRPPRVEGIMARREVPVLIVATLVIPLVLLDAHVSRWEAVALLALAAAYTGWMIHSSRDGRVAREASAAAAATGDAAALAGAPSAAQPGPRTRLALIALGGAVTLAVGGRVFVGGATDVARTLGVSERIVGLTIVALGTSLPELATSLIAAVRGHSDIAVGNVIGSNIFNVFLCLALASLAGIIRAPLSTLPLDIGTMIGLTLFAAIAMRTERKISRVEGSLLLALYVTFLVVLATVHEEVALGE